MKVSRSLSHIRRATKGFLNRSADFLRAKEALIVATDQAHYDLAKVESQYAADLVYLQSLCLESGCTNEELEWAGGPTPTISALADLLTRKLRTQQDVAADEREQQRVTSMIGDATQV